MAKTVWTDERIAKLKELWALDISCPEIGRRLGVSRNAAWHKGTELGLAKKSAPGCVWTPERLEILRCEYIDNRRTAAEVASLVGASVDGVRKRAEEERRKDPESWTREAIAPKRAKSPKRILTAADIAPSRFMSATDADLVAAFLATRGVTQCGKGTAAGLSAIERHLYAAPPEPVNWRTQAARAVENARRRRVAA